MGNRAVITTAPYQSTNVGIYVHWNGGRASVEGFLAACRELQLRPPGNDESYAMASLVHIIGLHFGTSGTSLGIGKCSSLDTDNGDNGTYLIGGDWQIVGRKHANGEEVNPEKTEAIRDSLVAKVKAAREIEARESKQSPSVADLMAACPNIAVIHVGYK